MQLHFCTSTGETSIPKLLALNESIIRHSSVPFTFWILCDGEPAHQILTKMNTPNLRLVTMDEFEDGDAPLLAVKPERNRFEYNCTIRPSWLLYLLRNHPEIDFLTYMDTDLYFFDDPHSLYRQMSDSSILLSEHRFYRNFAREVWNPNEPGIYNAGWIAFANDSRGQMALTWWRERCLEWCHDYYEDGKYGEQRYLNDWTTRFPGTAALEPVGANVAPWNIPDYAISVDDSSGRIMVNGQPLIFYHFHALQWDGEFSFKVAQGLSTARRQLTNAAYPMTQQHVDLIYKPYILDLEKAITTTSKYISNARPRAAIEEDPKSLLDYSGILLQLGRHESASRASALAAYLLLDRGDLTTGKFALERALAALSAPMERPAADKEQPALRASLYPPEAVEILRGLRRSRIYQLYRLLGRWKPLDARIQGVLSSPLEHAYPSALELLRSLRKMRLYRFTRLLGRWGKLDEKIEEALSNRPS